MTVHSLLVDSSLGKMLLQATPAGLSGLYFAGQKDCPALPGLPAAQGSALNPRAGEQAGRPLHSMRIVQSAQGGPARLLPDPSSQGWIDNHFEYLGDVPTPEVMPFFEQALHQLSGYFQGTLKAFSVQLDLHKGTDFQRAIWQTLLRIPYGDCWSYGQVAHAAGYGPGYGRATGAAVGANPITILVPCHRVVAGNQRLNGYSGGLQRKLALLHHEGLAMAA
jgi:methylated-DNA-[protein]-cysteine S-methyltransferase